MGHLRVKCIQLILSEYSIQIPKNVQLTLQQMLLSDPNISRARNDRIKKHLLGRRFVC